MEKLISVIIPTYNRSDKIERAIISVLNQSYKNIELIVIDDNANNKEERMKTKNVVEKYKNIKYIENTENMGGALTRNIGINNAQGDYIAFLDDDDEFIYNKLELQMKLMTEKENEGKNVALIYCYKRLIDNEGNTKFIGRMDNQGCCLFEHMKNCIETTSTWLCKKEALIKVGSFENVKAHQDNILLMKLLGNGYEIYRVPEILLNFYMHNGNGITKRNKDYIEYTKILIEFKKKFYKNLNKKEIEEIEYNNKCMLFELYMENKMKKESKMIIYDIKQNNKFRLHTLKMLLKYIRWRKE